MKPKIINETPMTIAEVKERLSEIKKKEKELNFRANKTEDYLNQVSGLDLKKSKELEEALTKLKIPRLRDIHIKKIVDTMPVTEDDAKLVLQGYAITVKKADLKKVADKVAEFSSKKK